jgi:hypothetical protein
MRSSTVWAIYIPTHAALAISARPQARPEICVLKKQFS